MTTIKHLVSIGDISKGLNTLPAHMRPGMAAYLLEGREPGSFLTALIENQSWADVVAKADEVNRARLPEWRAFFADYVPSIAWGSRARMDAWIAKFR